MANYSRGPRNDLIRELRAAGWSMRRIAKHPDVDLSPAMVHAVLKADEPTVDDDDEGAAAPRPGARAVVDDRAVLAELMARAVHAGRHGERTDAISVAASEGRFYRSDGRGLGVRLGVCGGHPVSTR